MGNLKDWDPFESYDLVDLGCGTVPYSIVTIAESHPNKKFLGIDRALIRGAITVTSQIENLHLIKADCTEVLSKLLDNSISEAKADFFLNAPDPNWKENKTELLKVLKQKLVPGAKLYISDMACNIGEIKELLTSLSYTTTKESKVEEMGIPLTPSMEIAIEARELAKGKKSVSNKELYGVSLQDLANKHKDNPEELTPVMFVATT